MSDFSFPPKYFPQVFAVKTLIKHQDKFLIIREEETSSWRPGKLGLPGGKIDPGEDWVTALARELQEELGIKATTLGLVAIQEIVFHHPKLNSEQLTHHFIFQSEITSDTFSQLAQNNHVFWYSLAEVEKMDVSELTEHYFPKLCQRLMQANFQLIPLDFIQVTDGLKDQDFQKWYSNS